VQNNAHRGANQNTAPSAGQQLMMMSFLSSNRAASDANEVGGADIAIRGSNPNSSSSIAPRDSNEYQAALAGMNINSSYRPKGPSFAPTNQASYSSHSSHPRTNNNNNINAVTPSDVPNCACGTPVVSRVVSKEGHNKGRPFFACQKSR